MISFARTKSVRRWESPLTTSATERFELRLRPEAERILREAAELESLSLSKFMLRASLNRAHEVIDANQSWVVPVSFFEELLRALDAPAVSNDALKEAAKRADELIERR